MEDQKLPKKELIHEFNTSKKRSIQMYRPLIFTIVIMLILGVGTGYIASNISGTTSKNPLSIDNEKASTGEIKKGFKAGVDDTKTFPDTVEGIVREGGID
ncbi:MAG: hypothetical protein Q7T54_03340, partial [Candidatus Levybacteria bacterium]|nr:hypothetical protein [Candidatus Levybacteria bacterium]